MNISIINTEKALVVDSTCASALLRINPLHWFRTEREIRKNRIASRAVKDQRKRA
jgi:hypothetical protein